LEYLFFFRIFAIMKLKIENNRKVWVTSDTHYSHANICRGTTNWRTKEGNVPINNTRDFPTIDLMNNAIVNGINSVVGQDDVLIHLGDWSFGGFEKVEEFRKRIICSEVYLVMGNHDHHIEKNKENCRSLFSGTFERLTLIYKKNQIEASHFPYDSWDNMSSGTIHLHGHTHLPQPLKIKGRRMDCGIDGHPQFRPYELEKEIMEKLLKLPILSCLDVPDHHLDGMIINKNNKK
jgi:calcineurin-like phosphoesterase family protein